MGKVVVGDGVVVQKFLRSKNCGTDIAVDFNILSTVQDDI